MRFIKAIVRSRSSNVASGVRPQCHSSSASGKSLTWSIGTLPILLAAGIVGLSSRKEALAAAPSPILLKEPVILSREDANVDVILSSGFLSFANHTGFLKAVEEAGLDVRGIMGTSAGALSGSLYAAGYTPAQVADELSKNPPSHYLQLSQQPWNGGILNMEKAIERYRELLPATFEELGRDFAVGVWTKDGEYHVIDSGPLPEAVVASAAIPYVFENVDVPGIGRCMDGGKFDRVGLDGWRDRCAKQGKQQRQTVVHLIERSSRFSGKDELHDQDGVVIVRSPKSGMSLKSLGDFDDQLATARDRAARSLAMQLTITARPGPNSA